MANPLLWSKNADATLNLTSFNFLLGCVSMSLEFA